MPHSYTYNLSQRFIAVSQQFADRTALRYPSGKEVSYSELSALVGAQVSRLRASGIVPGDVVALLNNKSPEGYAMMLASLFVGSIYSNLDLTSPVDRIEKIMGKCQPKVLFHDLSCEELVDSIKDKGLVPTIKPLAIDADGAALTANDVITGADPAYIMFTSGSTGFPKGAVMSHANILNMIGWSQATFGIDENDVMTNVNPIYFDNSVFDFYSAIFSGAALVPIGSDVTKDPKQLVATVDENGCTIWFSVPSMLVFLLTTKALDSSSFRHMRKVIFGGEGFPKPKLKKLHELIGDRVDLVNVYGPTECTCICSSYHIRECDFENMDELAPLGFIAPNFSYEILDADPEDGVGELFLIGPNVGLGYYNDERTASSFIQNPHNTSHTQIGYRTGDLVRKDENGHLHFKGRVDNQIKHLGYRIELEEIEAALSTIDGVHESAVVYKELGHGMGNIFAFVHAQGEDAAPIMEELKKRVPPYMYPKKINLMGELPKNRNGKIDRKELKNNHT